MAHLNRWVDISCGLCYWHSDTLTPQETKNVWRQYREHKIKEHPEALTKRQKMEGWVEWGDTFERKIRSINGRLSR